MTGIPENGPPGWNTYPPEQLLSYLSVENRHILYSLTIKLLISVYILYYSFIVCLVFQCSTYPLDPLFIWPKCPEHINRMDVFQRVPVFHPEKGCLDRIPGQKFPERIAV